MSCQIRLVGELVASEAGSADDVFQHVADVAVEVGLRNGAVLDALDDALDLRICAGLHQVVLGNDGLHGAFLVTPVGHHDAVEAPFLAEDGGEQLAVLLGELTVHLVV